MAALLFPTAHAKPPDRVEGEVLVTFKPKLGRPAAENALGRHALRLARHYDNLSKQRERVTALVCDHGLGTAGLLAKLEADPSVESVEPNYLRHTTAFPPNDPGFPHLWGLDNTGQTVNATPGTSGVDIRFLDAWRLARSPADGTPVDEIVIGVIDTGLDPSHPDLFPNLWTNPGEIPTNGTDDDANGYIDDLHGFDFTVNSATMFDSGKHGTHVAGTAAAAGDNAAGVIGVQYHAKILPLKVSSDGDALPLSAILAAYNYAIGIKQQGVNLVALNASFGGGPFSVTEKNAIDALGAAGVVLCAAAGNSGTSNDLIPFYPASYDCANIIAVAALNQNNQLASFSNHGLSSVDLAAPGENTFSSVPLGEPGATVALVEVGGNSYDAQQVQHSEVTDQAGINGTIVACGLGHDVDFPPEVAGNIALIQRGLITFSTKVTNAMNAGAVAAVIYDNTGDLLTATPWTLGTEGNWIPALRVTMATGQSILSLLPTDGVVINWPDPALSYQFLSGTSMATPHVTGAVAFAALNFPAESVEERINRVLSNTTPVSSLAAVTTTGGRLNLLTIVDTDVDGLPDWWETRYFQSLDPLATDDDDHDNFNHLEEFLAATDPGNPLSHLAIFSVGPVHDADGNHFVVSFPSAVGRSYRIEWSPTIEPPWYPLGPAIDGTGGIISMEDTNALDFASRRFYRVVLVYD